MTRCVWNPKPNVSFRPCETKILTRDIRSAYVLRLFQPKTPEQQAKIEAALLARQEKRRQRIKESGIDYDFEGYVSCTSPRLGASVSLGSQHRDLTMISTSSEK